MFTTAVVARVEGKTIACFFSGRKHTGENRLSPGSGIMSGCGGRRAKARDRNRSPLHQNARNGARLGGACCQPLRQLPLTGQLEQECDSPQQGEGRGRIIAGGAASIVVGDIDHRHIFIVKEVIHF